MLATITRIDDHSPRCTKRHCIAIGCERHVKHELSMCRVHWSRVPLELQREIRHEWRHGQADDGSVSAGYQLALARAINVVAAKEHRPVHHWFMGVDLLHASGVCQPPIARLEQAV
jgi:hypothetical protein